jgi:hypothetical protein
MKKGDVIEHQAVVGRVNDLYVDEEGTTWITDFTPYEVLANDWFFENNPHVLQAMIDAEKKLKERGP